EQPRGREHHRAEQRQQVRSYDETEALSAADESEQVPSLPVHAPRGKGSERHPPRHAEEDGGVHRSLERRLGRAARGAVDGRTEVEPHDGRPSRAGTTFATDAAGASDRAGHVARPGKPSLPATTGPRTAATTRRNVNGTNRSHGKRTKTLRRPRHVAVHADAWRSRSPFASAAFPSISRRTRAHASTRCDRSAYRLGSGASEACIRRVSSVTFAIFTRSVDSAPPCSRSA